MKMERDARSGQALILIDRQRCSTPLWATVSDDFHLFRRTCRQVSCHPCCSRSRRDNFRSRARVPPLFALRETLALPAGVRGPVDCSHGFHL
jgi:hypothetical protein